MRSSKTFTAVPQEIDAETGEHYRVIIENLTEYAIITLDTKGIIRSWNKGAEQLLGFTKEEAIGKSTDIFFTPEDVLEGAPKDELAHAAEYGRSEDERWHMRKDRTTFWGQGAVMPMRVSGELIGFIKIFRDRTEKKELETRKDEFVARASHELRTPLSIVKLTAEFLLKIVDPGRNREVAEGLKNINEQTDRLAHLVNDMLDLSKILAGKVHPRLINVSIRGVIEEVLESYGPGSAGRLNLLPGEDADVCADRNHLTQVLINLIGNALKYSPPETPVEISTEVESDTVTVYVRDYGIGIPQSELKKIFGRFYQVDGRRHTAPGLGIGLYICSEIIKLHDGEIGATSEGEGKGSTFYFSLPVNT